MQKVAAYRLERRERMNWAEARKAEAESIRSTIRAWLQSKGASDGERNGTYVAEDRSDAFFNVQRARDGDRSWDLFRLEETAPTGLQFVASVSVIAGSDRVAVYITLEVGSTNTAIRSFDTDPKCPHLVRELLQQPDPWYHGASRLRSLGHVEGFDEGEALANELMHPDRAVPFIVVSKVEGELALRELDDRLAYDLAGLANVFTVDDDASWALTDSLGRRLSCFNGAVRVYWPGLSLDADWLRHPLWTADRLRSLSNDASRTLGLFRRQLRATTMRAAALSVNRPREIDEIRSAASRGAFGAMKAKAKSLEDYRELADSYANENDELRAANEKLEDQCLEFQERVAQLEGQKTTILGHVHKPKLRELYRELNTEIEPVSEDDDELAAPGRGESRFYKKKYSAKRHDVMIPVGDCGHNAWKSAYAADKAKRGIEKLEGSGDWKALQHCEKCEGGGMWKVRW